VTPPHFSFPEALLILWQAGYLSVIYRRRVWFGLAATGYSIVWYALLIWVGAPWVMALTILTTLEAASVGAVSFYSPRLPRALALTFVSSAAILIVWVLAEPVAQHWRIVLACTIALVIPTLTLVCFISGFGKFGMAFLRRRIDAPQFGVPERALNKYTYWSARAVDSTLSDNRSPTRFSIKLVDLGIPVIGARVSFERSLKGEGRHAAAQELGKLLKGHIRTDARRILHDGGGFLTGAGNVYITKYGSQSVDNAPVGGRAALFTYWNTEDSKRVAVCLFGSMDNFDEWIQDSHPSTVTGWASSATYDVVRWLQQNEPWDNAHWGESIGNVACKMCNYEIALGESESYSSRSNYAKDLVGRQDGAEWLAFIYHVETGGNRYLQVPFDIVLIGRPFWLRAKHFSVKTSDEYSDNEISESERLRRERSYARFWSRALRLQNDSKGWPVYLYRFLLSCQGIVPEL
jgi:hypothetical protein